jgi:hypothetical protein
MKRPNEKLPLVIQEALNVAYQRLGMLLHPNAGLAIPEVGPTNTAFVEVSTSMNSATVNKKVVDALNRCNGRFVNLLNEPSLSQASRDGVKFALQAVLKGLDYVSKYQQAGPKNGADRDGALRCVRAYMESNSQMPEAVHRALLVLVPDLKV